MATPPSSPPVSLRTVLSESKRIIHANPRHYLTLSILFILPNSICVALYTFLINGRSSNNQPPSVLPLVAYLVIGTVFSLLAIGSIVHSVFHGFHGRQVKFIPAVKSSFSSFFPLLATIFITSSFVIGVCCLVGIAAFILKTLLETIIPGLEISFIAFTVIIVIISVVIAVKFQIDWILYSVIVVVESVWGIKSLKRSKSLTNGMKRVFLSIISFFSLAQLPLWLINQTATSIPISFLVIVIVAASLFQTFLALYNLAATTVMYMYCKDFHGEVDSERKYESLPFDDDGKDTDLVSVAYNNV